MKPIVNKPNYLSYLILSIALILTLVTLMSLLVYSHYGFDLTDESFYLNWISNPWIYSASVMQFGFIYHPLYLLLHGDIVLLRQSNILIIFGLTWLLVIVLFRSTLNIENNSTYWRSVTMIALAAIFATSSLMYFCPFGWLATPSYNSLILQAFILTSIGIVLVKKTASQTSVIGWILLGVGGWLAFMAKPPAAAGLSILVAVYLLLAKRINLRLLLLSVLTATVLLFISAVIIDGTIPIFIERFKHGICDLKLLVDGKLFRIDNFLLPPKEKILLAILSVIISGITLFFSSQRKLLKITSFCILLALTLIGFTLILNIICLKINAHFFSGLQILAVPLSAIIVFFFLKFTNVFCNVSRTHWTYALFFLLLPYTSAFGTGNNYWLQSQLQGIFWVLSGLIILTPAISNKESWQILLPAAIGGQLITIVLLQIAMEFPYRQPQTLHQYNSPISIGASNSIIMLNKKNVIYLERAIKLSEKNGFKQNMPIIDLTGQSAGLVYALSGQAIGQPWMMGGYLGSDQFAIAALNRINCKEIVKAWILLMPTSTRQISPKILTTFGIHTQKDYILAAEITTPIEEGNKEKSIPQKQLLLKPIRSVQEALKACKKMRRLSNNGI